MKKVYKAHRSVIGPQLFIYWIEAAGKGVQSAEPAAMLFKHVLTIIVLLLNSTFRRDLPMTFGARHPGSISGLVHGLHTYNAGAVKPLSLKSPAPNFTALFPLSRLPPLPP